MRFGTILCGYIVLGHFKFIQNLYYISSFWLKKRSCFGSHAARAFYFIRLRTYFLPPNQEALQIIWVCLPRSGSNSTAHSPASPAAWILADRTLGTRGKAGAAQRSCLPAPSAARPWTCIWVVCAQHTLAQAAHTMYPEVRMSLELHFYLFKDLTQTLLFTSKPNCPWRGLRREKTRLAC